MAKGVKVTIFTEKLEQIDAAAQRALELTAEIIHGQVVQAQVMPFRTGHLQNESTFVDRSAAAEGHVDIVSSTPYARRLYYHPEYNFSKEDNPNAGGLWFAPWAAGGEYADLAEQTFAALLKAGETVADNEVGKVSLGLELSTESIASQTGGFERKIESIAEKSGEKAGKKFANEAAKAFKKNSDKIGEAGEHAGEEAGKGAEKGLKRGSKGISAESGEAGDKAGKSFAQRFNKQAGGGSALKTLAGKIGKMLVAAFATKKLFDFGKYAIGLGSDLEEVQNVVDSTFGPGSRAQKVVNDFAQNAAAQFGLSETMAKRYSGTFGAMGKAFGFTSDQAAEMSTTLTGLAGDVASFYNITQDEAYTKLKSVFTGETESLKDLGVVMTQTALDQYALSHGFGTTTAKMSEQQKVALRYQFVLDKLSTASGDFARTSGSWANQVRLLKLQFESLAATIGQVLIAALTPAIRALNAFMGVLVKAANTFKAFVFSLFGLQSQDTGKTAGTPATGKLYRVQCGAFSSKENAQKRVRALKAAGFDAVIMEA